MTDIRALCAELLEIIDFLCEGDSRPDCDIVARARAYLAQPEPEELTEEEIEKRFQRWWFDEGSGMRPFNDEDQEAHVHRISQIAWSNGAYVARWGRPAIEPVPVSERPILKSSNFNDANGHCWCGTRASIDKTGDFPVEMLPSWELREPCAQDDCVLPHHALPAPTTITTETP